MTRTMDKITATPLGGAAFKVAHPFIRAVRRFTRPNVSQEHTLTNVEYNGRKFTVEHRRTSSDELAIEQCFTQMQYDMPVGAHGVLVGNFYQEIVASGRKPLIIDCGANIGTSVLWFRARYPEAHIVALEPEPANFELMRLNSKGLDVDARQAGVAATDGQAHIWDPGGGGMGCRTVEDGAGAEVAMLSIKTLLASKPESLYTPFLLKIDIEGYEKSLFQGDWSDMNRFPLIILEPHDWLFPGQLSSREFFRFHVESGREFCMRAENVASIACHESLRGMTTGLRN